MIHHPELIFREDLLTRRKTRYIVVHHVGKRGSFSVEDIHKMHLSETVPRNACPETALHAALCQEGIVGQNITD